MERFRMDKTKHVDMLLVITRSFWLPKLLALNKNMEGDEDYFIC